MKAFVVNHRPERTSRDDTHNPAASVDQGIRAVPDAADRIPRFDASTLSGCDEPVRRYFTHAIDEGAPLEAEMTLRMKGRIKIGLWLPFTAQQDCDGSSFIWRAQVPRHLRVLTVTDSYHDGAATIDGRLLGAVRMFHSEDQNIVRSAAARAATEGILAPIGLLPSPTCIWYAQSDNEIIVNLSLAPERPSLHLTIDNDGAVQSVNLQRWGNAGQKAFRYLQFGGDVMAEKRFGNLVLPARIRAGWWHGTERFSPFFEAEIISAEPNVRSRPEQPTGTAA